MMTTSSTADHSMTLPSSIPFRCPATGCGRAWYGDGASAYTVFPPPELREPDADGYYTCCDPGVRFKWEELGQ